MQSEKKCSRKLYTPEVIVVDNDNDPDTYKASKRPQKCKKTAHIKKNREVKVDRIQNMETLVVTQKVKVKKQKFKCIINLTNICKHKSEKPKSKRHPTNRSERIVPQCLRKCFRDQNAKKRSKQERSSHAKKKSPKPKRELDSISVISLSSLESNSELSYEDVSSDSFTTISSEDNIDILIKRTKDRDRQLSKSFSSQCSQNVNTAEFSEISDAETSIFRSSDKDSLHSTTTLLIAPQPEIYSPTRPTTSPDNYFYMDKNKSDITSFEENDYDLHPRKRQLSPTLTYDNKFNSENKGTKIVGYQHSCIIKNEPYSPSEVPVCCDQDSLPYEVHIKFEDTEMHDLMDKTKNPKSLDIIEGNPKIKEEDGLYSPSTNCILPEYDRSYTNQSNRSDRHVKVKIEKDVNGYENNENSVYIKSETTELDYHTEKIKEE